MHQGSCKTSRQGKRGAKTRICSALIQEVGLHLSAPSIPILRPFQCDEVKAGRTKNQSCSKCENINKDRIQFAILNAAHIQEYKKLSSVSKTLHHVVVAIAAACPSASLKSFLTVDQNHQPVSWRIAHVPVVCTISVLPTDYRL